MVARADRQLAETHLLDHAAERAFVQADAEARVDPGGQILEAPAHHAVPVQVRPRVDDPCQRPSLRRVRLGPVARHLAVDQPRRAVCVEGQHPVAHRLQAPRTDPRRLRAAAAILDRSQRQKPAALAGVPARPGQSPKIVGSEIRAERDGSGHGKPSWFT